MPDTENICTHTHTNRESGEGGREGEGREENKHILATLELFVLVTLPCHKPSQASLA